LSFLDARTGWAATPDELGMTADGGTTWTDVLLPKDAQDIVAIDLRAATDGYVLDSAGNLFITPDGGRTWSFRSLGPVERDSKQLFDLEVPTAAMRFFDADHGLVVLSLVGGGERETLTMQTADGGRTWREKHVADQFGAIHLTHDGRFLTIVDFIESDVTLFRYQQG
jgi:photosystem II stability/assembly factor-like uncharacterized protein